MLVFASVILLLLLIVLVIKSPFLPGNIMAVLPIIVALAIGSGLEATMMSVHEGISDVLVIAALFITATIFFGVVSDAGMFDPIINGLMKTVGKSVFSIVGLAAVITLIAALDGQGIAALLITAPPMLIVFDKLKIRRTLLALVFMTIIPMMNFFPWAGPTARAAAVIGMDVMVLYKQMILINVVGVVLSFILLYIASKVEERRGEFISNVTMMLDKHELSEEEQALRRPKLFWPNLIITIIIITTLFLGIPSYIAFLVGCAIVLPLNYRTPKEQSKRMQAYSGPIMLAVYTLIGAGALLGVMENLGMFEAIGNGLVSIIPESMNRFVDVIVALLITPLSYILDANAMIYGVMPVIAHMGEAYGLSSVAVAIMFVAGHNVGSALCITNPTVYFALGIMKLEFRETFKANFKYSIILGTVLMLFTLAIVR